ncbi:MAG: hypothetical protein Q8S13_09485, partial [Dehalococcoidia bacterium]|nr:hypothetical protein [Dehalococcoidia bacterium]
MECTLRAAIEETNANPGADTINFSPTVFSAAAPATIPIGYDPLASEDAAGAGTCANNIDDGAVDLLIDWNDPDCKRLLPAITEALTIDGTGAGVILEPAKGITLDHALVVWDRTPANTTDFSLIGNSFMIRGFEEDPNAPELAPETDGDAIFFCGDLDDDGVAGFNDETDCGGAGAASIRNVTVDGVILALQGDTGIEFESEGAEDVTISDNQIFSKGSGTGSGDAINFDETDLDTRPIQALITRNLLVSSGDDAIFVDTPSKCHLEITFNTEITGQEDGIDANGECGDGSTFIVEDNGPITGHGGEGIEIDPGDNSSVSVQRNGDILGGDDEGVEVLDGHANVNVDILDNGHITGGSQGVDIDVGDGSEVDVSGNGPAGSILGSSDDGVEIDTGAGSDITVSNNGNIFGGSGGAEGIDVDPGDNPTVTITDNLNIVGTHDGIEICCPDSGGTV